MVDLFIVALGFFLNYQCHFKSNHSNYKFLLSTGWVPSLRAYRASLENIRKHMATEKTPYCSIFPLRGDDPYTRRGIFKAQLPLCDSRVAQCSMLSCATGRRFGNRLPLA